MQAAGQSATQPAREPAWPDLAATSPTWALPLLGIGPQEPERLRPPVRGSQHGGEVGGEAGETLPHLEGLTNSSPEGSQRPPKLSGKRQGLPAGARHIRQDPLPPFYG